MAGLVDLQRHHVVLPAIARLLFQDSTITCCRKRLTQ